MRLRPWFCRGASNGVFASQVRFYRNSWGLWTKVGRHIKSANRREGFLAYFGPLSLIPLMGFWALGLIFGFACVQYGLGEHLHSGQ